jgi:hypothetical protein
LGVWWVELRPILNFARRVKLWPQVKLSLMGGFCPLDGGEVISWGWNSLFAPPYVKNSRECSSLWVNEGVNTHPRALILPLVKLRMTLWDCCYDLKNIFAKIIWDKIGNFC